MNTHSRRDVLKLAATGAAGLTLRAPRLSAQDGLPRTEDLPVKRYFLFPQPDGSECPNVKKRGLLLVDIDGGRKEGCWTVARQIETPLLSRIPHGNGPGIRGATVCAGANRCYVSASDGRNTFYLVCVDLGSGKVIYEKEVPGIGRLQVAPDGSTVFLPVDWFGGQSACAVDAETAEVKRLYPARYRHHLAMGPSGRFIYAAYDRHAERAPAPGLHVIDAGTLEVVREIARGKEGPLFGGPPHIQVDAAERYVYSYCRLRDVAMQLIEPATGTMVTVENRSFGDLWPALKEHEELTRPDRGGRTFADAMPSYHGIAFFPGGKRAWIAVEGNRPDLVEWDLSADPPRPVRVLHAGSLRRGKGWAFITRKGDLVYTSNGRIYAAATGGLLGEVQYPDGSPLWNSKPCEVHMRGDKVVFGSSSVACGYPAEQA